jgi:magnesium and cobalt transporter
MAALKSPETTEESSRDQGTRQNGSGNGAAAIGIGNLSWMRVVDVALPRADIVAVPSDITLPELVQIFRDSGMTRLPVYRSTLDTPIGMVHLKDLALKYGFNGKSEKFSLKGMLRPLLYAPPSMPIGVLLQKMQKDRMHMALVIDEYGGTDGLVTIEDLIEQVIGEIEDEHDEPEDRLWAREKPGVYLVQAKALLSELEQELGLNLIDPGTEEEIDTLGGLVFKLSGRVPARGEVIPHENGTEFEVVDADSRRIKRVRVRFQPNAATMAPAAE